MKPRPLQTFLLTSKKIFKAHFFKRSRPYRRSVFTLRDIVLVTFLIFAITISKRIVIATKDNVQTIFLPPPEQIQLMTFGYHETVASSLWIRFLQDIEICGKNTITREQHEQDLMNTGRGESENAKPQASARSETDEMDKALFKINSNEKVCVRGWSFRVLNAIVQLSPQFRPAYAQGATSLSVLANDHTGAKVIFDKGVEQFPNDWVILYRAAYLYLYEMRDFQVAAHLLHKASKHGAPPWVNSLASRLFTRMGQAQLGYTTLLGYYKTLTDEGRKAQVAKRLKKLEQILKSN